MTHDISTRASAIRLRKAGYSLKEVSEKLHIAKSTASLWLADIELSASAQKKLVQKQIIGQYKTVLLKKQQRLARKLGDEQKAQELLRTIPFSRELTKLLCALLWWCEGNKHSSFVRFTSSDETLIENYLHVFRNGFDLDEKKFRVLVHLHNYHNDMVQKTFWSEVTKIPLKQFHNSFHKPNTGKRKQDHYQGCIAVTYYDANIAKELEAIYNSFTSLHRGIG